MNTTDRNSKDWDYPSKLYNNDKPYWLNQWQLPQDDLWQDDECPPDPFADPEFAQGYIEWCREVDAVEAVMRGIVK